MTMAPDPSLRQQHKRSASSPGLANVEDVPLSPAAKRLRGEGGGGGSADHDKENWSNAERRMASRVVDKANGGTAVELKPPECGVITRIYCENFMCHRKLTVDLCRNVNFVYGQNGSGKSAILAAIQICLGAGARRTHRARNLKDLVRKDSNVGYAKVRVTLLNKGSDAFRYEDYGDQITVERTIASKGGYNGYKLFNYKMEEVSRSKKDLDELLDKVNAQVENPVAILDQEEAKKFLTGKAEDKYAFFMKATELERIDRTIAVTMDKISELNDQEKRLEGSLTADVELVRSTKQQWEQHKEIDKLKRKLYGNQEGFAWALYQEANEKLMAETETLNTYREKTRKREEDLTQEQARSQGSNEENEKRDRLEELTREANTQADMKREIEQQLKKAREPKKMMERNLKILSKDETSAQRTLEGANRRLQEKRDEIISRAGSAESEAARRTQRLQKAEGKLEATKREYDETKQATNDWRRKYDELQPDVQQARSNASGAAKKVHAIEARLASLQSSSNNSVAMFGQRCAQLQREVARQAQQNRFQGPVLGPIGAFVKIAAGKDTFAPLAELALGSGTLDRFVVTNDHDRKALQALRRKVGCQYDCGIFQTAPHARYNIPDPPVAGIETVASVLSISNDTIFNCLVDNCKIDERALARSREESEQKLLFKKDNGEFAIRGGMKSVYFLPKGDSWVVQKGYKSMYGNEKPLRKTIGVDKTAAIEAAKADVSGAREELSAARKDENRLEVQHNDYQKKWNQSMKAYKKLSDVINKIVDEIDAIKAEQDTAENFDTDTSDLEQDVQEAQAQVQGLKEQKRKLEEDIRELEPNIGELKAKLEETTARNSKVIQDMDEASKDLTQHMTQMSQREEKLEKKKEKIKQYHDLIRQQEETVNAVSENTQKYLRDSRKLAYNRRKREEMDQLQTQEGVPGEEFQFTEEPTNEELEAIEIASVEKKPEYYRARVEKLTRKIEQEKERRNASKEDALAAYEKYQRAKEQLNGKMKQLDEVKNVSKSLGDDVRTRKNRWKEFRQHIADNTSLQFDEILNQKGSSGTVEFDFDNETLDLVVQKDAADANSQQKDVKALSGGERSYTTIALLLALGESLETPFRILDEFDVFLDPVTRKLTIEALIHMAKSMPHRQFVFITPQDVSNVETDPMLKVLKMTPPNRTNRAGGPSQQTLEFSQS